MVKKLMDKALDQRGDLIRRRVQRYVFAGAQTQLLAHVLPTHER